MDERDWPKELNLWDLLAIGDQGQFLINPAPFDEQWTGEGAQVIALQPGQRPPASGVMAHGELHVACESRCTAPGSGDRQALAALRAALRQIHVTQNGQRIDTDSGGSKPTRPEGGVHDADPRLGMRSRKPDRTRAGRRARH
ncbi:hypothetical protein AB0D89_33030 [Streptomyces luteogriseus]|uniref:hypothetical protein n=1 Tax=Streptomyces luteogriseus TaxID=68233 RepID=UPI0033D1AC93